jgi:hypothetical protein
MRQKMKRFFIGQKVKLKKYSPYSDYQSHEGQIATVVGFLEDSREFNLIIEWEDGFESHAHSDNLIGLDDSCVFEMLVQVN